MRPRQRSSATARLLGAALLSATAGCSTTVGGLQRAGAAYEDFLLPLEGLPQEGRRLQQLPLAEVATAPSGWREYELGRRYHVGQGVPHDEQCAAYWYDLASTVRYEVVEFSTTRQSRMVRFGIPHARVALRRLAAKGAPLAIDNPDELYRRCFHARPDLQQQVG